jgi:protein-tyrosine phosphatase
MTDRVDQMQRFPRVTEIVSAVGRKLRTQAVVEEFKRYRAFEGSERLVFLKSRIWDRSEWANPKPKAFVENARAFVFVCFGNIMRSPMCEQLMKRAVADFVGNGIRISSAGLNAVPGRAAHPWAIRAAQEFGISLEDHRARLLTSEMVHKADVILVMDRHNFVQVLDRWSDAKPRIVMLSAYGGNEFQTPEIFDPYYTSQEGTVRCYQLLQTCIQNLVSSMAKHLRPAAISEPTQPCGP